MDTSGPGRTCPGQQGVFYKSPPCLNTPSLDKCCYDCCGIPEASPIFKVLEGSVYGPEDLNKNPGNYDKLMVVTKSVGGKNVVDVTKTIAKIQQDIMTYGPIATSMAVPSNFETWWNTDGNPGSDNIFSPANDGNNQGGHAIVLTGWGETNGVRWWEMRNSWGLPGYCRFAMTTEDVRSDKR